MKSIVNAELDTIHDLGDDYERALEEGQELVKTAKSEAIKEFAKRLKEKGRYPLTNIYYEVIGLKQRKIWLEEDIDNLVKEMTEEKE